MKKITIIVFLNNYLPGEKSGGPVRSVANLVEHLGEQFYFKIITTDRDLGDDKAYSNINVDKWNKVGNASVFYMSSKHQSLRKMLKVIKETPHNIIYLNSFFNFRFSILPLVMRKLRLFKTPILLAPRGELMEGCVKMKWRKKKIYMAISLLFGIYDNCTWQASSDIEANSIKNIFHQKTRKMIITPNLPSGTYINIMDHVKKENNHLKICYVSRIVKKKNLFYIFEILRQAKNDITFDIYGPIEDTYYWSNCQKIIGQLPKNIKVAYGGNIANSNVIKTISNYDLFFLPTYGENFGHCIIEAMLAGTPVLISNTTPWRDLESKGIGWDKPLNRQQDFLDIINKLAFMNEDEYLPIRKRVLTYAKNYTFNNEVIEKTKNMFSDVYTLQAK